jgi:glucose/arabinose dehydrogenase
MTMLRGNFCGRAARAALLLTAVVAAPQIVRALDIALTPFASGLTFPVDIVNAGDSRLFVVEKAGHIRVVQSDGTVLGTDFLDVSGLVSGGSEQGLLGLAFHPNYLSNGFFYVNYTDLSGDTQIARYSVSGDPTTSNVADPLSATPVLSIGQPFSNHNGGDLIFGPDGYLYIGMGDGGSGCDPGDRAQNPMELLGKMLRIDVDSGSPYAIPPSNPFAGSMTIREEIWALGTRNPFRFSFDRSNGNLYIGDVGQNTIEEIDFQLAASTGGQNYGWNCYEGDSLASDSSGCMSMATCAPSTLFTFPVHTYDHTGGRCSVTGGYVYRGSQSPAIAGHYFFADYCSSDFYSLTTPDNGTTWNFDSFGVPVSGLNPTTFGEGVDGEVYVGGQSSDTIYRITSGAPPAACPSEPATGCTATTKAQLKIKNDAAKSKLIWKWQNGPSLAQGDFGDPVGGSTSYTLCIYGGTGAAKISAGIPGVTGWKTVSTTGYKLKDSSAGGDGVFKALLKGGDPGKSKLLVKAKGSNLDLTAMPFNESMQVTSQLIRNDAAGCWEAVFPAAAIDLDDATQFKAKIP